MPDLYADDATFTPVEGLEVSEVPDGRVIYQADRERVHYFNPTAVVVFELCSLGHTVGEIGAFLKDAYNLETVPATEVQDCLRALVGEGLLNLAA